MASTRTFSGVTIEVFNRMRVFGRTTYGIVYDPPNGFAQTATAQTPLGECAIEFLFDQQSSVLTLTLVKRPWLLPEALLWSGFAEALNRCRKES